MMTIDCVIQLGHRAGVTRERGTFRRATLADELAEQLNRIVPDGVELSVRAGDAIWIAAGAGNGWRVVEQQPAPDWFAWNVLAALQDEIIEFVTHTGWPPTDPTDPTAPQRAAQLPQPGAAVEGDSLVCWYGDRATPAVAISPISLS